MNHVLYIDTSMGAAGDMLTGALLELLDREEQAAAVEELNNMGIPGVHFSVEKAVRCGITGLKMRVSVNGLEEDGDCGHEHTHEHEHVHEHTHEHAHGHTHEHVHEHTHEHAHEHTHEHAHEHTHEHDHEHNHESAHVHSHAHHGMKEIAEIVNSLQIPDQVRAEVLEVYRMIADAESRVHGIPVTEIHFHEVGAMDAVADIAAFFMLLRRINPDEVIVSPVCVGSGTVRCAHGILPVPAPATAVLLEGMPFYSDERRGEMLTPTGAALLKTAASSFGPMPVMTVHRSGFGMGTKEFPWANCVRVMLGERAERRGSDVHELSCNLDDMTAEQIGYAAEELLRAGALDVWTVPIGMKKSRPGTMLQLLCEEELAEEMAEHLFRLTTTLGIREQILARKTLRRRFEQVETPEGPVRYKLSEGYGICREKPEYDDLAALARARECSIAEAAGYAAEYRGKQQNSNEEKS